MSLRPCTPACARPSLASHAAPGFPTVLAPIHLPQEIQQQHIGKGGDREAGNGRQGGNGNMEVTRVSRRKGGCYTKPTREHKHASGLGPTVLHTSAPPRASLGNSPGQQLVLSQMPWVTKKGCSEALRLLSTEEGKAASPRPPAPVLKAKTHV